jgi:hypothetical protein
MEEQSLARVSSSTEASEVPVGYEDIPPEERQEEYVEWHLGVLGVLAAPISLGLGQPQDERERSRLTNFGLAHLAPKNVRGLNT